MPTSYDAWSPGTPSPREKQILSSISAKAARVEDGWLLATDAGATQADIDSLVDKHLLLRGCHGHIAVSLAGRECLGIGFPSAALSFASAKGIGELPKPKPQNLPKGGPDEKVPVIRIKRRKKPLV